MTKWHVSIPDPSQLMVLYRLNDQEGAWFLFEHVFPSYISVNPHTMTIDTDVDFVKWGCMSKLDKSSLGKMYAVEEGHRYGVYRARGDQLDHLPTYLWNSVPKVDYRGVMPFMLHAR